MVVGQGIGWVSVMMFVKEGVQVFVIDINVQVLVMLVEIVGICILCLDVMDVNVVVVLVCEEVVFDVLFNCVGFVYVGSIFECLEDDWVFFWQFNVMLMYWFMCVLLLKMFDNGGVLIINMVFVVFSVKGVLNCFVYGMIKVVVIGMIKVIVVDFVLCGICCNVICLGIVEFLLFEQCIVVQVQEQNVLIDIICVVFVVC